MADEMFLREHLALIRELAEQADPPYQEAIAGLGRKIRTSAEGPEPDDTNSPLRAHRRTQPPTRCALFPSGHECGCQPHPSTEPVPTNPRPELACSAA